LIDSISSKVAYLGIGYYNSKPAIFPYRIAIAEGAKGCKPLVNKGWVTQPAWKS